MNKPNFFRSFKRELAISPIEYIIKQRLLLAKRLLSNPGYSISDAVYKSGFNNVSYFSQLFKRYEGI